MKKKQDKQTVKLKEGRPSVFDSVEEMNTRMMEYFDDCPDKKSVITKEGVLRVPAITMTGLCIYLGFESRQSFYDYEKRPEFSYIIKRARLFIERNYEQCLQLANPTGSIFALKNMGWSDKSEIDHNVNIPQLPNILIKTISKTD